MTVEEKIKGKNPRRVLPQWKRAVSLQRQRIKGSVVVASLMLSVAAAAFFLPIIPRWIQVACFICLPFQIIGFLCDWNIYHDRKVEVAELERLIERSSNQAFNADN